jgi:hypothetical protein
MQNLRSTISKMFQRRSRRRLDGLRAPTSCRERLSGRRCDETGLYAVVAIGSTVASRALARLLAERGDEAGLRALVEKGNDGAAHDELVKLLAERDDQAGLHALAGTVASAGVEWARLLARRGDDAGL